MNIKPCISYSGYSASDCGRIFSSRRRGVRVPGRGGTRTCIDPSFMREMKPARNEKGYLTVGVRGGPTKTVGVHRLVLDAHVGPMPEGMEVRHLDGNPENNLLSNLCYGTSLENAADRNAAGGYRRGGDHINAKITNEQAAEIRQLRQSGVRVKELAKMFRVGVSTVENIIYGISFKVLSTKGKP